ncbi:MAG: hypothetical protein R3272_12775 [Candidatus Promineifilaceae bacterium]|nr:hypothetical protein [Candidatus Promineifilaceae bacterium]
MRLDYEHDPRAGQEFHFRVLNGRAPVKIVYYVGNRPYGEDACTDEPCDFVAEVPAHVEGEFLRLVVSDNSGSEEYRLRIRPAY